MSKAIGIVAEYNPFHNGHAHHLREAKRIAGNRPVIAAMSGLVRLSSFRKQSSS